MDSQDSLLEETVRSLGRIQLIGKQKDDKIQVRGFTSLVPRRC